MSVLVEQVGKVRVISINRPRQRNAVDSETAKKLAEAFSNFEEEQDAFVAILTGKGECFSCGADPKVFGHDGPKHFSETEPGLMGPTRMRLSKPVIAAIEGEGVRARR